MESFPAQKRYIFYAVIAFLSIVLPVFFLFIFLEPSAFPQNIIASNINEQKVSISWTTRYETKGAVIISQNGKFPVLPIFVKLEKDIRDKKQNKLHRYTTHYIKISQLLPETSYKFRVYQGLREVYQGEFKTGSILPEVSPPNPVYGKIVNADRKTPASDVIVYLRVGNSSVLSTLTNKEGRWSLDLSNLRTNDLKEIYRLNSKSVEDLIVDSGSRGRFTAHTQLGKDKPWPNIILKPK